MDIARSSDESSSFLYGDEKQEVLTITRKTRRGCLQSPVWTYFTVVLLAMLAAQTVYWWNVGSNENGYGTELGHLKRHIRLHRTRFASPLRGTAKGDIYAPESALDDKGRRFTGIPSPEIDEAWYDLIFGRYVRFTSTEIKWLDKDKGVPDLIAWNATENGDSITEDGFYGGPDMLHSLHCINALRKHIDKDYYQASMPALMKPVKNEQGKVWTFLGETEREHTCRNGEELGKLWRERGLRDGMVSGE